VAAKPVTPGPWEPPAPVHGLHQPPGVGREIDPTILRSLATKVIERAAQDARGKTGLGTKKPRQKRAAQRDARQWIEQAGDGLRFWAAAIGADWRLLRHRLLALDGHPGDSRRSKPPGEPTKTCRNTADPHRRDPPMEDRTYG
jgi:hypothetical protein